MIENCHIKELRMAAGLNQTQLARIAGIARNSISNMETGVYFPSLRAAMNIAFALGVDVNALYDYSPEDILP